MNLLFTSAITLGFICAIVHSLCLCLASLCILYSAFSYHIFPLSQRTIHPNCSFLVHQDHPEFPVLVWQLLFLFLKYCSDLYTTISPILRLLPWVHWSCLPRHCLFLLFLQPIISKHGLVCPIFSIYILFPHILWKWRDTTKSDVTVYFLPAHSFPGQKVDWRNTKPVRKTKVVGMSSHTRIFHHNRGIDQNYKLWQIFGRN